MLGPQTYYPNLVSQRKRVDNRQFIQILAMDLAKERYNQLEEGNTSVTKTRDKVSLSKKKKTLICVALLFMTIVVTIGLAVLAFVLAGQGKPYDSRSFYRFVKMPAART